MNVQIDATAAYLKTLEDEIDYIPKNFCSALDEQIQTTLTENADATSAPAIAAIDLLDQLATVGKLPDQDIEDFQLQIFTEFVSGGFTEEEIDFALPRDSYPATCSNAAAEFAELAYLVDTTKQAETYVAWLQNELATACDGTQAAFAQVEGQLAGALGFANAVKEGLVADFFVQLGGEDDTMDSYRTELEEAFNAAVAADSIDFPSEFDVQKPETPELCASLVEDASAQVDADVEAVRALEDFTAFTEATVCGTIGDEVFTTLNDNASLVEDTGIRVIELFRDLSLIEAGEGETQEEFALRVS